MDIAIIHSRALAGIDSPEVSVEVHLSRGLPGISIVGMPETAVKESRERVRSAILNNRFEFPLKRIIINLAPADLPKDSGRYDLPIAIGILAASGQIPASTLDDYEFIGELALTGNLRAVPGVLPVACAVKNNNRKLILPRDNAAEAAIISGLPVLAAANLLEVCSELDNPGSLTRVAHEQAARPAGIERDMADIYGQVAARRALEICASGGHNLLLIGPPGSGKTMLAERLPGLLPALTETQALETASVWSVSRNGFDPAEWKKRPFRNPHHTASSIAITGGGSCPRPGEVSLAHNGILFLDELPEFNRHVLEVLREPMESRRIIISRAARQVCFPASFQFIAAMNPCPCGHAGEQTRRCNCSGEQIRRYRSRISGPLLDRIDLHVEVPNISAELLNKFARKTNETSCTVRQRVCNTRQTQQRRQKRVNAYLDNNGVERFCRLDKKQQRLLAQYTEKIGLSTRSIYRILRVARTIADMDQADKIAESHLAEAVSCRFFDRTPVYAWQ